MASTEVDVHARIALAWVAFHNLKSILKSKTVSIKFKINFLNAACVAILLYGCETWVLTPALEKDLDVFARTAYRIILGINQAEERLTNIQLYEKANNSRPITEQVRTRQLKFTGHCLRMD